MFLYDPAISHKLPKLWYYSSHLLKNNFSATVLYSVCLPKERFDSLIKKESGILFHGKIAVVILNKTCRAAGGIKVELEF